MEIVELFKKQPYRRPGRKKGGGHGRIETAFRRVVFFSFASSSDALVAVIALLSYLNASIDDSPRLRLPRRRGMRKKSSGENLRMGIARRLTLNGLETIYPFRSGGRQSRCRFAATRKTNRARVGRRSGKRRLAMRCSRVAVAALESSHVPESVLESFGAGENSGGRPLFAASREKALNASVRYARKFQ